MSSRDIIVHTSTNVFAGSGTTSITLLAMIYYLCRDPKTMAKLIKEIDKADWQGLLSSPISYKQSNDDIPYVEAVMKESMRIYPGIGLLLERHVPEGHHDPKVFPNLDQFIPERWTDSCNDKKAEKWRSFFAFGAGTRTCIGRNIAFIEIQKVITQLLRQCEETLAEPEKEWNMSNVWMVSLYSSRSIEATSLAHPRSKIQQKGLMCSLKRRCNKS